MYASLRCGALSANALLGPVPWVFFVSIGRDTGLYRDKKRERETPFAKKPFSWFLNNFCGMELHFFGALNFQISEPEIWQKSVFLWNIRDFPANFGL